MTLLLATALALSTGCSEYDLKNDGDVSGVDTATVNSPGDRGSDDGGSGSPGGDGGGGDDDGGGYDDSGGGDGGGDGGTDGGGDGGTDGGTDGGDGGDGGGDDTGEPPRDGPPVEITDECPDGATVSMSPSEIYVLSWDSTAATATLTASDSGYFHIYDYSIAESGSSQWNESGYVRVSNATNTGGEPVYANCGYDWIVSDSDNYGPLPSGSRIYIGTFWLDAGSNTLTLNHYCPLYRAGECPAFHKTDTSDTCDNDGVNSVHVVADGLCVTPAE